MELQNRPRHHDGTPLNRDLINSTGLDELLYLNFIYHELGHDVTIPVLNTLDLYTYSYVIDAARDDMPYLTTYDGHYVGLTMIYEGFADAWADYAISHVNHNYTLLAMQMQKAWGEFWVEWLYNEIQSCALDVKSGSSKTSPSAFPARWSPLRSSRPPKTSPRYTTLRCRLPP